MLDIFKTCLTFHWKEIKRKMLTITKKDGKLTSKQRRRPCRAARWRDPVNLSGLAVMQLILHWSSCLNLHWCSFTTGKLAHVGFWQSSEWCSHTDDWPQCVQRKGWRINRALCVRGSHLSWEETKTFLDSGYIYFTSTSSRLKEPVLTDGPPHRC